MSIVENSLADDSNMLNPILREPESDKKLVNQDIEEKGIGIEQ